MNKEDLLKQLFNASEEDLKEWEKYGESIQEDKVYEEIMNEELVIEAIMNTVPDIEVPLFHKNSPISLCYARAASDDECEFENDLHYQYIENGELKIHVRLKDDTPVNNIEISISKLDGEIEILPLKEFHQDKDDLFINLGKIEEIRKNLKQIREKLNINIDDKVDINLEIYLK